MKRIWIVCERHGYWNIKGCGDAARFLQLTAYFAKRKHVRHLPEMWHKCGTFGNRKNAWQNLEPNEVSSSERRVSRAGTQRGEERGYRSEQAFILAACDNELRRGENADATTQFEARVAATLTNLAKQVQGLQTLAHAQVALTDVFLKYVITAWSNPRKMRYPRRGFGPGCGTKSWCVWPRKGSPTRTETLSRGWWQHE